MSIYDLNIDSLKKDNNQLQKFSGYGIVSHPIYLLDSSKSNVNLGSAPTISNGGVTLYVSNLYVLSRALGGSSAYIYACKLPIDGSTPIFTSVNFTASGGFTSTYVDGNKIYVNYTNSGNFRVEYDMDTDTWSGVTAGHYTSGSIISTSYSYNGRTYEGDGLAVSTYAIPLVKIT